MSFVVRVTIIYYETKIDWKLYLCILIFTLITNLTPDFEKYGVIPLTFEKTYTQIPSPP